MMTFKLTSRVFVNTVLASLFSFAAILAVTPGMAQDYKATRSTYTTFKEDLGGTSRYSSRDSRSDRGRYDSRRHDSLNNSLYGRNSYSDDFSHSRFPSHTIPTNYRQRHPDPSPDFSRYTPRAEPDYQRTRPDYQPLPQQPPVQESAPSEADEIQLIRARITGRYTNPVTLRLLQRVNQQNAITLYRECSQLIDNRHLSPSSYQTRIKRGFLNLMLALEDPAFLQANGIRRDAMQVRHFQQTLSQWNANVQIQSSAQAEQALQTVMSQAAQQMGIPAGAVAVEFVYAAAESLDKYSAFEPKDDRSAELESESRHATLEDHIVGIGVEVKTHEQGLLVVKPVPNGPAAGVGVQPNDLIVSINGRSLTGIPFQHAVDMLGGQSGTHVMVGLSRNGRTSHLTLTRKSIPVYTVSDIRMLDQMNGVGYFKLERFGKSSKKEVEDAMWKLHRQGMKTLVFDVRDNPGGLLTTAIEISNLFLPCGQIVSTRGRTESDNMQEAANYQQTWKLPLVVLVNGNSASASEIFAAAIQDNKRGLVVGQRSYGKGTVQTHFPLRSVTGNLRLTTAKFYSPAGKQMAGNGVTPDVSVDETLRLTGFSGSTDRDIEQALEVARSRQLSDLASTAARCRTQFLENNYR